MDKPFVILDGAMGTELAQRSIDTGLPLWSANALLSAPGSAAVERIHRDYIAAGAQVITTDTFRTNVRTLVRAGMLERMRELTFRAVELARAARAQPAGRTFQGRVQIAGSIAPVEDCYSPQLVPQDEAVLLAEHTELARSLAEAGCDLLLVETMNTVREAVAAARAATATGLPVWVSFTLGPDNRLLSGETLREAVHAVLVHHPQAVLMNCIPVAQVSSALVALRGAVDTPAILTGAYANAGHVEEQGWSMEHAVTPQAYAQAAAAWLDAGAGIIGGCCGTSPDHIRALAAQSSEFRVPGSEC